jgi:hypothetical protein
MPVSDYHVRNEEAQDCKEYAPSDNLARLQQCQLYDTVTSANTYSSPPK